MPRIQFSDVTPPNKKRSIRDVPIPSGGKRKVPVVIRPDKTQTDEASGSETQEILTVPKIEKQNDVYEYYYPKKTPTAPFERKKTKKKQFFIGGLALVAVFGFIFCMMTVFASATVSIIPKNQTVDVDIKITGSQDVEDNTVKYEIIRLTKTKTSSVSATGEEAVELKASGKIVIYNNYSAEPQRLIVRTRFESPEGLIFRIPESVIVPGKSLKNGVETPGSVEVEVFADEAGEKYNIEKTDFTIPGFKNDSTRYKNFYARSSTEMSGGFVGKMKTVSESDKKIALQNIETELRAELGKELSSKVPDGLVLLNESILYETKEIQPKNEGSDVSLGEEITAYAVMFNTKNLSEKIIGQYITTSDEWSGIPAEIVDFSSLKIQNLPPNIKDNNKVDLSISGQVKVWAKIDTDTIRNKLIGVPKKNVAKLIDEFAGISSITASLRPIWKQSFPKDVFKIHVKTVKY